LSTPPTSDGRRARPPLDLRPWFQTLDDLSPPLDWTVLFGNARPVELDVGSGRGLFLVSASQARPDTNFAGIELDYKEARRAARRLWKRKQANARVIGGDALRALSRYVPPQSIAAVHVYFPDPWWKRRHKRRRVFTDVFVEHVRHVLVPGGLLHAWTDVEDYFEVMRALLDHHQAFEALAAPPERPAEHDLDYQTSFERKKRKLGAAIHRGLWRKRA
jgi:tRNA (guanine-N7-)-methyltransferase